MIRHYQCLNQDCKKIFSIVDIADMKEICPWCSSKKLKVIRISSDSRNARRKLKEDEKVSDDEDVVIK